MDQNPTVQASTRKAAEANSKDLRSAMSSSTDTTATHEARYFDFFALPRELRDMIYDQFHRLHPDTPIFTKPGQLEDTLYQSVRTKPITSLLLVSKIIGSEYRQSCTKRLGVNILSHIDDLALGAKFEAGIHSLDAERASFIHIRVNSWLKRRRLNDTEWTLGPFKDWLAHWDSQMPNLDSITVSIYLNFESFDLAGKGKIVEDIMRDFVCVPKLKELEVVAVEKAFHWRMNERGSNSKKLLVYWTPSDAREPTLINCEQPHAETCGECLDPMDRNF